MQTLALNVGIRLQNGNYRIKHVPEKNNIVDLLSRIAQIEIIHDCHNYIPGEKIIKMVAEAAVPKALSFQEIKEAPDKMKKLNAFLINISNKRKSVVIK